jgi:predicted ATPase
LTHLRLGELNQQETKELISHRLGIPWEGIPDQMLSIVFEKSQGNPLFVEELVHNLMDMGIITVEDNVAVFHYNAMNTIEFPDSIQAVMTNRIDALPPIQQMILKVASVIGRSFDTLLLFHVFPMNIPRETSMYNVEELCRREFFIQEESSLAKKNTRYSFTHLVLQARS